MTGEVDDDDPGVSCVSEAVVIWTAWGESPWPDRDEQRLVSRLGSEAAVAVLPKVLELEDDFYRTDAHHTVADLKAMADEATGAALAWCYSFDYR